MEDHQNMVTEKIIKDVKQNLKDEEAKKNDSNSYYCPAEPNFYVAILIRNNACMKNMLYGAKDYIAYGQISYELLRKLVYTRGAGGYQECCEFPSTNEP
ncbi:unnamed protein product [Medioppia subpectinata]|uniref:Uncharacterized protein n=1 Tax=Medioppia subpectinata TaxID=1979941 RepID=A0A7R9PTL7_9ACAR|nr:unnamed protein product [Medioppia subpectinata]CAG2100637.1 unnamed protein product [Medioppia subpectinata]